MPTAFRRLRRRLGALIGTSGGRLLLAAYALVAVVGAFLPLTDHLGFELAFTLTIAAALFAPAVGVSAIRYRDGTDRPGLDALSGALYAGVALALPVGLILLNGLRRPVCDPLAGLTWLLLLPLPTAALASTLGSAVALRVRRGWKTWAIIGGALALPLGLSLWEVYAGPAFFFFDHLFGYYPGPLYDEVVVASAPLLAFRGLTVLWTLSLLLFCAAHAPRRRLRAVISAAVLPLLLVGVGLFAGPRLGWRATDRSIAAKLGGFVEIDGLEIHHPKEWTDEQRDHFVRDAAFRADQVRRRLGLVAPAPVRVWIYRSTDEKRRMVGAARTSFAKPWRREIHIHASGFPHPVLRHELVHAFAADAARGPFRTPGGLLPNSALIEGLAMAFDVPAEGELTLEQWAKAMRDRGLAPDLTALLSPRGFHTAAASRAYTYTGAFLRYLESVFGAEKVLAVYASNDLSELGDPGELVAGFERHLDEVPVGEEERATAQRRYARPSIFRRPCARDVSRLVEQASAIGRQDPAAAVTLYQRACDLEPGDPSLLRSLLGAAVRAKRTDLAAETAQRILAHPSIDESLRALVLIELGDTAWRDGRTLDARMRFVEAAQLPVDASTHRNAVARMEALESPERESLLRPLLLEGDTGIDRLLAMQDHLRERPGDGLVAYLLGRQLVQRKAVDRGIGLLQQAAELELPDRSFERENKRLLVRALAERHRCPELNALVAAMPSDRASAADLVWARDWAERCAFETTRGWSPN